MQQPILDVALACCSVGLQQLTQDTHAVWAIAVPQAHKSSLHTKSCLFWMKAMQECSLETNELNAHSSKLIQSSKQVNDFL